MEKLRTKLMIIKRRLSSRWARDAGPACMGVLAVMVLCPLGVSGSITLLDGATSLGTAMLAGGSAQVTASVLAGGSHSVTARYGGDTNFSDSTSALLTHTVAGAPVVTITQSPPSPSTTATFAFTAYRPGITFQCSLVLQTAADVVPTNQPTVASVRWPITCKLNDRTA
jgi:Bacterial Ig-like domain (group 3)